MLQDKTSTPDSKKFLPLTKRILIISVTNVFIAMWLWKFIWPGNNALIHTSIELICIFIAVATFLFGWHNFRSSTGVNELVGLGFLVMAIFGVLHAYYYYALGFYPENYIDLSTRYGMLQRITEAIVLFTITLSLRQIKINRWILLALTVTFSVGISVLLFLYPGIMPRLIINQEVTKFKILLEYVIILTLIVTFVRLKSDDLGIPEQITKKYICTAVILAIISEILLTLFHSFHSLYFIAAHIFGVTSHFYIFKGIFISSISYPYKQLEEEVEVRRRAEAKLSVSEELFIKAFYANPNVMSIADMETLEYLDVNKSFSATFGYAREEAIGRKPTDLIIKPELYQLVVEEIKEKGMANNIEHDCHNRYGEPVKMLASFEKIELQGKKFILASTKDITEMVRLEREMERLDRLKLVGQMSASISHEVRNPLTTVRGFLQMLQINELDEKRKEFFDITIEELDRCNSIITEFLSLAQDKTIDLEHLSLNHIIDSIYPIVSADAANSGIEIQFEKGNIPHLMLDEKEIRQLILNLIRNGIEAMTSGTLNIRTYAEGGETVIAVQDQGTGIKPEVLAKLGTPFITTKDAGTGLGLPVCYTIAHRHNAVVDVETGKNGTTFFIRFNNDDNAGKESKAS